MGKDNFKKMKIWLSAMDLFDSIFKITAEFPKNELYSLTSQINRIVISAPSNIAEGSGRSSYKDFNKFLKIGLGSFFELQTQIVLVCCQKYIQQIN